MRDPLYFDRGAIMTSRHIRVVTSTRSYEIVIGAGVLDAASSWAETVAGRTVVVVTDAVVGPIYVGRVRTALQGAAGRVLTFELPGDGEALKEWSSVSRIADALLDAQADRRSVLVALGGGVVGDLAGFAAACYMRGIDFIQVPTTLLAQVDSSVGGKTGINLARGKNLIGAFHQPVRVIADIDTLATLPQRHLVAGLAEVIKYGVVADDAFLAWIEAHLGALLARDVTALAEAVRRSCEIKAQIVALDEHETGRRVVLNFGHTFGHAIESGTDYAWLHGEAVGCGMAMACEASRRLGLVDAAHAKRIVELIRRAGLPTRGPDLGTDRYLSYMRADKKAEAGEIRLVLLAGPGCARVQRVADPLVAGVLQACVASAQPVSSHSTPLHD